MMVTHKKSSIFNKCLCFYKRISIYYRALINTITITSNCELQSIQYYRAGMARPKILFFGSQTYLLTFLLKALHNCCKFRVCTSLT